MAYGVKKNFLKTLILALEANSAASLNCTFFSDFRPLCATKTMQSHFSMELPNSNNDIIHFFKNLSHFLKNSRGKSQTERYDEYFYFGKS